MLKVYFDESTSVHLARGMSHIVDYWGDIEVFVTSDMKTEGLGRGATDEAIAEYVGKKHGFIITCDRDFRQQRAIAEQCRKYKVGVFLLDQNCNYWQGVKMLIKYWEDMVNVMRSEPRPFWYTVKPRSLRKLPI